MCFRESIKRLESSNGIARAGLIQAAWKPVHEGQTEKDSVAENSRQDAKKRVWRNDMGSMWEEISNFEGNL